LDIYAQGGAHFIPRGQYEGIANTIVQLIDRSNSVVIAASQRIWSDERHFQKTGLAAPLARQEEDDEHY
jgi:hypothetical protein